jgi:hypothetical protein
MTGAAKKRQTSGVMEKLYELLERINQSVSLSDEQQSIRQQLETYINELIQQDFPKLVELLYRVDVNEKKLKGLLAAHPDTNSATLITDLLIERQLQKHAWRQAHKPNSNIPDDERW